MIMPVRGPDDEDPDPGSGDEDHRAALPGGGSDEGAGIWHSDI